MSGVPRLVIAAPSSGHGKTAVAIGLLAALRQLGLRTAGFKIGPDYVDAAYLALAADHPARNLDPRLVGDALIAPLFLHGAAGREIAVVEGAMGLYDGLAGHTDSDSTAQLAGLLRAPVLLVVDAGAMGQSVAALAHGFRAYDEMLWLGGVILNRVVSDRHEQLLREALDDVGITVFGALRRHQLADAGLPSRGQGVVPVVQEAVEARRAVRQLGEVIAASVDLQRLVALARSAPALTAEPWSPVPQQASRRDDPQAAAGGDATARVSAGQPGGPGAGRPAEETRPVAHVGGAPSAAPAGDPPAGAHPGASWAAQTAGTRHVIDQRIPAQPGGQQSWTAEGDDLGDHPLAGHGLGGDHGVPDHGIAPQSPAQGASVPARGRDADPGGSDHTVLPTWVHGSDPGGPGYDDMPEMPWQTGVPGQEHDAAGTGTGPHSLELGAVQPDQHAERLSGEPRAGRPDSTAHGSGAPPIIAVAGGPRFSYGYTEVLDLLAAAGAQVVPVDPLRDEALPPGTRGLVLGGGLPEAYVDELAANLGLIASVRALARSGGSIVVEGVGLAFLTREYGGRPMAGLLSASGYTGDQLALGYREATASSVSPFLEVGTRIVGYRRHRGLVSPRAGEQPAWSWPGGSPEGFVVGRIHASYLCLHWAGVPQIAQRLVATVASAPDLRVAA